MHRTPVVSSDLYSVGYDPSSQTLEIEFNSGGVYQYYNVPQTIYEQLMMASSHNRFFRAYIRNVYEYSKIDAPLPGSMDRESSQAHC